MEERACAVSSSKWRRNCSWFHLSE